MRLDIDGAEPVAVAFVHGEGDDEAFPRRIIRAGCGDDLGVGKAVLEVEGAQQVAVGFDPVGVVDIGGLEESQPAGLGRLDDAFQPPVGKGAVADEDDLLDSGLRALLDLEDEVGAAFSPVDRLRRDLGVVAAGAAIGVLNARDVVLDGGFGQGRVRFGPDLAGEILVLDLLVALELHAVDDRRFCHGDDEVGPGPGDRDVFKPAGREQGLDTVVDSRRIQPAVARRMKMSADRCQHRQCDCRARRWRRRRPLRNVRKQTREAPRRRSPAPKTAGPASPTTSAIAFMPPPSVRFNRASGAKA